MISCKKRPKSTYQVFDVCWFFGGNELQNLVKWNAVSEWLSIFPGYRCTHSLLQKSAPFSASDVLTCILISLRNVLINVHTLCTPCPSFWLSSRGCFCTVSSLLVASYRILPFPNCKIAFIWSSCFFSPVFNFLLGVVSTIIQRTYWGTLLCGHKTIRNVNETKGAHSTQLHITS